MSRPPGRTSAAVHGNIRSTQPPRETLNNSAFPVRGKEAPLRRSDGSHLPAYRAIRDEHRRYKHVMGVFQDLSEKQAARACTS